MVDKREKIRLKKEHTNSPTQTVFNSIAYCVANTPRTINSEKSSLVPSEEVKNKFLPQQFLTHHFIHLRLALNFLKQSSQSHPPSTYILYHGRKVLFVPSFSSQTLPMTWSLQRKCSFHLSKSRPFILFLHWFLGGAGSTEGIPPTPVLDFPHLGSHHIFLLNPQ